MYYDHVAVMLRQRMSHSEIGISASNTAISTTWMKISSSIALVHQLV
jgi:hypothetical protein